MIDGIKNGINSAKSAYEGAFKAVENNSIVEKAKDLYNTIFVKPTYGIDVMEQFKDDNGALIKQFELDVTHEEMVRMNTQINDYVLENGNVANLTNILQPRRFVLTGVIGELIYNHPRDLVFSGLLGRATNLVEGVGNIIGSKAIKGFATQLQGYVKTVNKYTKMAQDIIDKGSNIFNTLGGMFSGQELKQMNKFKILTLIWQLQCKCQIRTNFCSLDDMYIENIEWRQKDFFHRSEVTITFKECHYVQTQDSKAKYNLRQKKQTTKKECPCNSGTPGQTKIPSAADTVNSVLKGSVKNIENKLGMTIWNKEKK